ncbi:hypothetical protein LG315_00215 [Microbacterium marinum]|uniref:hypothetical protein n=1 Tax=Microbacterium marinum TaxID=421115 RepID=UPI00384FD0A5
MTLDVHDSDIGILTIHDGGVVAGPFYLGVPPEEYVHDQKPRVRDVDGEAQVLHQWACAHGANPRSVQEVATILERSADDYDLVEEALAALFDTLGIPVPDGL